VTFPAVTEKTANKSMGLLFYAAPCRYQCTNVYDRNSKYEDIYHTL